MKGRVLIVAGSDSGGGAGIQADIKAVTAMDGFAATAITALTAQNTLGVHSVVPVDPSFIARQIEVVLTDIGADALKTGMLHSAEVIRTVVAGFRKLEDNVPLVVDPVMVAKGGHRLLQPEAEAALRDLLLPMTTLLTPNLPEAEVLVGFPVRIEADMMRAGEKLCAMGPGAVLLKGGHLEGDRVVDLLFQDGRVERFEDARIVSRSTHGTGCTLASAIAAGMAQKMSLYDAVARARAYVRRAIETAPGFGHGHGPLNHAVTVKSDWN
ncbi:hydroxymethylpyrimidine/phosphomethylpyrimidine kinase [Enhydrobacter aerosaccus]|uniref:hydroxymethylpyrimidine kinase n=1 Tax=Enhydrobacter aerosaccus TaxID=225324 RepID=A0A1T4K5Y6_9HYPH|nr:bifunctional hydroxymethylpyrimidine kinase/phosphomethylpyrimidine kinase [Enhydrobacter aerosaccus]SJZ37844.1 hydroxymethylpyrimidine/phosphomethylpyrimidine kinase [Enhydrobacter aerosaccus]